MREQERKSRDYWDVVAKSGEPDGLEGLLSEDPRLARYRDAAEKAVLLDRHGARLRDRGRLLEIGCGGGRWTEWLAPHFRAVVASDISSRMVERTRERMRAAGLEHVECVVASMEQLAVDGDFDVVYLGSCMHYMSDEAIEEGLAKVAGHTRAGATLFTRDTVSTTGVAFRRQERYGGDDPAIYRPAAWYGQVMTRNGFALVDQWPTYVKPLAWRVRALLPARLLQAALDAEVARAPAEVRWARLLHRAGAKDHRFFAYERR